jgi:hypothetical protein
MSFLINIIKLFIFIIAYAITLCLQVLHASFGNSRVLL